MQPALRGLEVNSRRQMVQSIGMHIRYKSQGLNPSQIPNPSRAYCANRRLSLDSSVQCCRFQVGLLQRHTLRRTSCDSRCTAASAAQPSQGRLPAGRSNRHQTTSQVAPLAASQASSDIQDGVTDVQDDVLLNASIFE